MACIVHLQSVKFICCTMRFCRNVLMAVVGVVLFTAAAEEEISKAKLKTTLKRENKTGIADMGNEISKKIKPTKLIKENKTVINGVKDQINEIIVIQNVSRQNNTVDTADEISKRKLITNMKRENHTLIVTITDEEKEELHTSMKKLEIQINACKKELTVKSKMLSQCQMNGQEKATLKMADARKRIAQLEKLDHAHREKNRNLNSQIKQLQKDIRQKDRIIKRSNKRTVKPNCKAADRKVLRMKEKIQRIFHEVMSKSKMNDSCKSRIKIIEYENRNQIQELRSQLDVLKQQNGGPGKNCFKEQKEDVNRQLTIIISEIHKIIENTVPNSRDQQDDCYIQINKQREYFVRLLGQLKEQMASKMMSDCSNELRDQRKGSLLSDILIQSHHKLYQHLQVVRLLLDQCTKQHGPSTSGPTCQTSPGLDKSNVQKIVELLMPEINQMLRKTDPGSIEEMKPTNLMVEVATLQEMVSTLNAAANPKGESNKCTYEESDRIDKLVLMIHDRDKAMARLHKELHNCRRQPVKLNDCKDVYSKLNEIDGHVKTLFVVFRDIVTRHHTTCNEYPALINRVKVELNEMHNDVSTMTKVFENSQEIPDCGEYNSTIIKLKGKSVNQIIENYLLKVKLNTCILESRQCQWKVDRKCPDCMFYTNDPNEVAANLREKLAQCQNRSSDGTVTPQCKRDVSQLGFNVQLLALNCRQLGSDNRMLIQILDTMRAKHRQEIVELRRLCSGPGNQAKDQALIVSLKVWFDVMKSFLDSCTIIKPQTNKAQREIASARSTFESVIAKKNTEIYNLKQEMARLREQGACWARDPHVVRLQSIVNVMQQELDSCIQKKQEVKPGNCPYLCPSTTEIEANLDRVKEQARHEVMRLQEAKDSCDRQLKHFEIAATDTLPWYRLKEEVENICVQKSIIVGKRN